MGNTDDRTHTYFTGMFPDEISNFISDQPPFRGKQIFSWIYKGARVFEEMSNLPKQLRTRLKSYTSLFSSKTIDTVTDKQDGTKKNLIQLKDGNTVESVLLSDGKERLTACISTQVGCAMGCSFCQTGQAGFIRNLETYEIIEQYLLLSHDIQTDISNIVYMGMGEPLLNYDNVIKSVNVLAHPDGRAMSTRRITISTCGIPHKIKQLAEEPIQTKLALSLSTADSKLRKNLMPITEKYSLKDVKDSLIYFQQIKNKRITLEMVLLGEENTRNKDIEALKEFTSGLKVLVNIIPWNPTAAINHKGPTEAEIKQVSAKLDEYKIPYTIRRHKGRNVDGACGQLKHRLIQSQEQL